MKQVKKKKSIVLNTKAIFRKLSGQEANSKENCCCKAHTEECVQALTNKQEIKKARASSHKMDEVTVSSSQLFGI